jgi:hypothetical protein
MISPIIFALFFVAAAFLAILIYWLDRAGNSTGKDLLCGTGGLLFGGVLIWRAFAAISDGSISLSKTKLGNGTFPRVTETTEFWIYVLLFAVFGVMCLSICTLVLCDLIRAKLRRASPSQKENQSAS